MSDTRPTLDQLRRDAKRLLNNARAGDLDAARRLDTDPQTAQLAAAQRVVAREHGFRSWPRLVRDLDRLRPASYRDLELRRVQRLTVCCFLPDGELIMVDTLDGFRIPTGAVEPGEDPILDSALRIPLQDAGFRRQGTHVAGVSTDGRHLLLWVDGARYYGNRPHREDARWWTGPSSEATELLRSQGDGTLAASVELADRARRELTDEQAVEDLRRLLDPSYLRAETAEGGSGFGGTPQEWRAAREQLCDAIESDGSFLDIGCANGLLMESVVAWSAERGHRMEPYGIDHSPALVDRARQRLPQWADRIWVGDALTWRHPDGLRFDVVAMIIDVIRPHRYPELIKHLLDQVVAPGGRLLLSRYSGGGELSGAEALRRCGYPVDGETSVPARGRLDDEPGAWVINR
ncbi:class I SAM-dependent methyltransferase [Microlunatus elymi]|uniref:Class I SAM-dependent methyltransferase n=1 Tax=Microlunatus elymi TaxID=2596828 RepID=A0A516PYJ7_9ACTN|nr:class I SAM-dependent methyltransferase [Microlunatus elymi]QDP96222.1 class I SAM-dependent methyltransferase [Microlunatus elymi]